MISKGYFDECVIDGKPFKVYRQDAGMGEHDYCVLRGDQFYCRTNDLDTAKEIIHAVLSHPCDHCDFQEREQLIYDLKEKVKAHDLTQLQTKSNNNDPVRVPQYERD